MRRGGGGKIAIHFVHARENAMELVQAAETFRLLGGLRCAGTAGDNRYETVAATNSRKVSWCMNMLWTLSKAVGGVGNSGSSQR